jgi:sugar lactone lactonase YvrE
LILFGAQSVAATGDIHTFAGGGTGDTLVATQANLNVPVTMLQAGTDLYIADSTNQRVRKVDLNPSSPTYNKISTVAGNSSTGSSPSGTPALSASLYFPSGLARNSSGTLYFSDSYNNRILKIEGGNIVTVAGGGPCCLPGDGPDATQAYISAPRGIAIDVARNLLYIADVGNSRIRRVNLAASPPRPIATVAGNGVAAYAGDGAPAVLASLKNPWGVALSPSGTALFIADTYNSRIRKVDLDPDSLTNGFITTVAGSSLAGFGGDGGPATSANLNQPIGVAADSSGNIFIADTANSRVRKVDSSGTITTVAGTTCATNEDPDAPLCPLGDGLSPTSASLLSPFGVALDPSGNLLIADSFNARVRKVASGVITTIAGNGNCCLSGAGSQATVGDIEEPRDLALAGGNAYIAVEKSNVIWKVDSTGVATTAVGNEKACKLLSPRDGGFPTDANLCSPHDVAATTDGSGNLAKLYIADTDRNVIRVANYTVSPPRISTVAGGLYDETDPSQNKFDGDCGQATLAHLWRPKGVAVDASRGVLYIADTNNNRIRRVNLATGVIGTVGLNSCGVPPSGGNAPSLETGNSVISGGVPIPVDQLGLGQLLAYPGNVAMDATNKLLYVADTGHNRIWQLDPDTGAGSGIAGNGTAGFSGDGGNAWDARLWAPSGVTVVLDKPNLGNNTLYIADTYNSRIRKVNLEAGTSTSGFISTVAGQNGAAFSGDGGPATSAHLWLPEGVAAGTGYGSATGVTDLFIADTYVHRVRRVEGLP